MSPIAALLLTGGASRRMGMPKATLVVAGETLAERGARLLAGIADPVLEVGPGYTALACIREQPPGRGPLAAVGAAADALPVGSAVLVLAVDMPGVTTALLEALARHPSTGTVVPVDADGRPQPLCARYSPEGLRVAADLVASGRLAMRALLDAMPWTGMEPAEWMPLAGAHGLADVDRPTDLAAFADRPGRP